MCDEGVSILYHESESVPWVLSIPWVHIYTMTPCVYHESLFIPWVHVYTMSPCLYHESMCIPWVLVNSMHLFLYHKSLPITWVNVYTMSPEIQITKRFLLLLQKYNFQKYRDTNYRNKEIQITDIHKYKLHKYRNTNDRNTEIQITEIKICKLQKCWLWALPL